jgi:hypothetical protein
VGLFYGLNMASTNEHTGDSLVSKANTKEFDAGYDLIFKKPINLNTYPKHEFQLCPLCGEVECDCDK